jgi:hypothetical protein
MRQEPLFYDARRDDAPRSPVAHLRLVASSELAEGWNEPCPPKRDWVVYHFYGRDGVSLCERYRFEGTPLKAHFQVDAPTESHYRHVVRDWLCKRCLARRLAREMF